MGYIHHFLGIFRKKTKEPNKIELEGKTCPLCWGYQVYDEKSRTITKDKQIDVKNHRDTHVKVGKFMVEHLDGFKNKKRIIVRCPECGSKRIKYKENP